MSIEQNKQVMRVINNMFKSEKNRTLANLFLQLDHLPTHDEIQNAMRVTGLTDSSVYKVIKTLKDKKLLSEENGSIPLLKMRLQAEKKAEVETSFPGIHSDLRKPSISKGTAGGDEKNTHSESEPETSPQLTPEMNENRNQEVNNVVEDPKKQRSVPQIDKSLGEVEVAVQSIDTKLDGLIKSINGLRGQISLPLQSTQDHPAPNLNQGPPQQPTQDAVVDTEVGTQATQFDNMSKEQIVDFFLNNPLGAGRKLPGGLTEKYVYAPPEMIRKMIIEVTTYTQDLYQKALSDKAFDGTFSDFLNYCPAKYFEDRGLVLGWQRLEPHPGRRPN